MVGLVWCIVVVCVVSVHCKQPNIIFILSDDLGYGDYSISEGVNRSNSIPTPHIQSLADNGMKFTRSYSGPVCAPSRCTLMTGRDLGHCTVRGNDGSYSPLLPTDVTVAKVLQKSHTTGLVGKWGLGDFGSTGYPLQQGFDTFIGQDSQVSCHNWYPYRLQNNTNDAATIDANKGASEATCGAHRSKCKWSNDFFKDEAVDFIRRNAKQPKPFFLYYATTTPHTGNLAGSGTGYPVPGPYDTRFGNRTWTKDIQWFAGAVSAQDDMVGAVLHELQAQGIEEDTVIFFSGDNGPDSHDFKVFDDPGPFRGKKRSIHEGGMRQTVAVQWKGKIQPGTTSNHVFTFWDFLPSAADLAGIPETEWPPTDGVSAAPTLLGKGEQKEAPYWYWEFCTYSDTDGLLPRLYPLGWGQAVRLDQGSHQWKAIRANRGSMLLFDLTNDVSESHDISKDNPTVVSHITSIMEAAHVDSKHWKASNNATDRCCAGCFKHGGCAYPCIHNTPPPPTL